MTETLPKNMQADMNALKTSYSSVFENEKMTESQKLQACDPKLAVSYGNDKTQAFDLASKDNKFTH